MAWYNWSRTAGSNATADTTINWAEGQAPSTVNDSARAMMARTAEYRDDIAGAIATGGSSTAYTVTSYQVFDTLAHLGGQMIAFVPHATNTNAVGVDLTLNVDGLGAKSVRIQPGVALPGGSLVLGTPYVVTYNNSDAVFYLRNMTNPYLIPLGGGLDYWGVTAPNSSFAFSYGQAISRTTYATLFTLFSTTYGVGDGSTTFNLPDMRGRVGVPADNMGGVQAGRTTTTLSNPLGSVGGFESRTIGQVNLPNVNFTLTGTASVTSSTSGTATGTIIAFNNGSGVVARCFDTNGANVAIASSGNISGTAASGGSGTAVVTLQPSIVCNYILRII